MKQSRLMSFVESCGNTLSGFFISLFAQWLFLPFIGVPINFQQNLIFAVFMTFVSVARSFGWRRLMEALHVRHRISPFVAAVIAERRRQQDAEGWSLEHDDAHDAGELARAGAAYALWDSGFARGTIRHHIWVWTKEWFKPDGSRRNLVKAAALIVAEGEKFDRTRKPRREHNVSVTDEPSHARLALLNHLRTKSDSKSFDTAMALVAERDKEIESYPLAHGKARNSHAGTSE